MYKYLKNNLKHYCCVKLLKYVHTSLSKGLLSCTEAGILEMLLSEIYNIKISRKTWLFHLCQNEKNVYLMVLRVTTLVLVCFGISHFFSFFHEIFLSWQLVKDCCAKKMGVVNLVAPEVKRIVMQSWSCRKKKLLEGILKKKTDYWLECCRLADEIILSWIQTLCMPISST